MQSPQARVAFQGSEQVDDVHAEGAGDHTDARCEVGPRQIVPRTAPYKAGGARVHK
jgi:hypothetical protein